MKIMILSDSHSMTKQTLLQFIKNHPASYYIHCGDIYMPYTPLKVDYFYNVRGNNDFVDLPDLTLDIDHLEILYLSWTSFHIDESPCLKRMLQSSSRCRLFWSLHIIQLIIKKKTQFYQSRRHDFFLTVSTLILLIVYLKPQTKKSHFMI